MPPAGGLQVTVTRGDVLVCAGRALVLAVGIPVAWSHGADTIVLQADLDRDWVRSWGLLCAAVGPVHFLTLAGVSILLCSQLLALSWRGFALTWCLSLLSCLALTWVMVQVTRSGGSSEWFWAVALVLCPAMLLFVVLLSVESAAGARAERATGQFTSS